MDLCGRPRFETYRFKITLNNLIENSNQGQSVYYIHLAIQILADLY